MSSPGCRGCWSRRTRPSGTTRRTPRSRDGPARAVSTPCWGSWATWARGGWGTPRSRRGRSRRSCCGASSNGPPSSPEPYRRRGSRAGTSGSATGTPPSGTRAAGTTGWLHAVAHGADAAGAFGAVLPERRVELLRLCARRMTAPETDYRYAQLEDARLARAVCRLLAAPGLGADEATGWLDVVSEALEGGGPGPVPVWAGNTFATLQSLHVHLTRGLAQEGVPPHAHAVADRVAALLRLPLWWLA
ncbi:DUF2785 domain-containing protein [Streptomyces sp. SudanB25_2051]|uniref:DUF2785 domain-containing protein n=1 Tax=Streptomyces sp. SudanB25_2051 TaxID=3035275 RepID=UPI003F553A61